MNSRAGTLFVVATPIGNLKDITLRAIDVLNQVDLILAEDTRHSSILLQHLNIRTPVKSFHDHNEVGQVSSLLRRLGNGEQIALISDAGTPLISDPGYHLVQQARRQEIDVIPVPGASALIAALSVSGQATDRFCFEGFLPARSEARKQRLQSLKNEPRTLLLYESSHRITQTLDAIALSFGADRWITVAREISKKFETFYFGTVTKVIQAIAGADSQRKGEFVIVVSGADDRQIDHQRTDEIMALLVAEMPLKRASKVASKILGQNSNELYAIGLKLKNRS